MSLTDDADLSLAEVLALVRDRGLMLALEAGKPVLRGDLSQVTGGLVGMLKLHRDGIIERLSREPR